VPQLVSQVDPGSVSKCPGHFSGPGLASVSALLTKQRLLRQPYCRQYQGGQFALLPASGLRLTCVSMPLRSLRDLSGPLSNQFEGGCQRGFRRTSTVLGVAVQYP
jgi:hypothetical protein